MNEAPSESAHSSAPQNALLSFEERYCDPEIPFAEIYEGINLEFPTIHFHDQIDDRTIILRSGLHTDDESGSVTQVFWLATYDAQSGATIYDVISSEKQILDPFTVQVGGYEIVHTAKSRDEKAETIEFRVGSRVLEWTSLSPHD